MTRKVTSVVRGGQHGSLNRHVACVHVLDVTRVHPVACMPDGALNCCVLGDRHRDRSHRLHERDPFELGYHARSTGSTLIRN